ncbi:uncharacterized protein TRIADDRAFT_61414 [Trichoplax adhaerens]|uniref:COR domain-containing protein n=1 Tax=Trichoplax adhaerens TaxID=10228 RepID=B3SAX5_TRIAD|nr:predicted protein [Trichoplax adhaerens]EDV20067.1 predicted protein [Trichoplax adhaerens]|eukprot:XP_002117451.1 predicted protein [Trichoplax adhaerens]
MGNKPPSTQEYQIAIRYCSHYNRIFLISVDKKEKDGLQNSYRDVPSALKEKEYKEAYAKARREGFCRNDFIRFMITGPQNVGKSCFIQAFTQQGLIRKIGPTTAAVVEKKLVKLLTYNVDNKTVDEFIDVLARKVVAAIETVKRKMREERPFTDFSFSDNPRTTLASQFPPYVYSHSSANNADHIASQPVPIDEETIPLDFLEKYFREGYKLNKDIMIDEYHYGKLWDFAGQSIYHITHQPFISCNCIYILVLDMSQDIDKNVVDRSGNDTKMTYLEAIQEWLVSIIGSSKSKVRTENKIIGAPENIAWPIVILIGTHADKIGDEKACQRRFKEFCQCINEKLPSYSRHIYRSKIIFNCNDKDNSKKTLLQRQKNCGQLHNILKDFVHNQPSIDHFSKIPFKWYIMAAILHTSLDRFNEQAVKFSTNLNQRVSRIMTAEEVELLAKKYKLCEGKDDIHQMLLYLHDLGEIVYCQKEPVKGKVITQVEWLLNIFRTIIQLDEPDSNGLAMDLEYEAIRNKGIMSQHYIYGKFDQLEVKKKEKKFLLDLMESYDMICKISNKDDNHPDQYFVPYLFRSNNQEFDHKGFMTSGWLYVGFKSSKLHYIPDGIFFCLLVSCYKEWKGSSIEPRSKCAKYRLKNDFCDIIVKKESSYIGIQYRYRIIPNNPRLQGQIKDKVKKLIYEKPPYIFIRNKLESLIKERMPRCQNSDCLYFIKCPLSPCDRFLQIKNPVQDNLKLLYCDCNGIYECESAHGWTISLGIAK